MPRPLVHTLTVLGKLLTVALVILIKPDNLCAMDSASEREAIIASATYGIYLREGGLARGLALSYHLNGNTSLGFAYQLLTVRAFETSRYPIVDGQIASVFYKKFLRNSLYSSISLEHEKNQIAYRTNSSSIPISTATETTVEPALVDNQDQQTIPLGTFDRTNLHITIGNQWQWQYFTLGCDWVGLLLPLRTLDNKKESAAYWWQKGDVKVTESRMKNPILTFVSGYIGFSF